MKKKVLALLLAVLMVLPITALAVETDGTKSLNGHFYKIYAGPVTPVQAEKYCNDLGGHLVTITSQEEQNLVAEMAESAADIRCVWIGGTDRDEEGVWTWMTGEAWNYTSWSTSTEPNNGEGRGSENYIHADRDRDWDWVDSFGMYDKYGSQFGFVCEWDGGRPSADLNMAYPAPTDTYVFRGHTYQVITEAMTPPDAEQYCKQLGGHLITVTSLAEQEYANALAVAAGIDAFTMGATDRDREGVWTWMNGEPWEYANWSSPTEPNDGLGRGEDYAISAKNRDWKWVDVYGGYDGYTIAHPFICEWDGKNTSFWSDASAWAVPELEKAAEMGLVPDVLVGENLTKPITRAEFAAVAVKTYEALSGTKAIPIVNNPFTDCADVEVLKAYGIGAVNGTSATTFSPDRLLNREQAATMLTRVFKRVTLAGWTLETDGQFTLPYTMPAAFADDGEISAFARDSVYFMAASGIIKGISGNKFAPKNVTSAQEAQGYANATREQALAIAVRMVENLK